MDAAKMNQTDLWAIDDTNPYSLLDVDDIVLSQEDERKLAKAFEDSANSAKSASAA